MPLVGLRPTNHQPPSTTALVTPTVVTVYSTAWPRSWQPQHTPTNEL
jgi:hypothetical protein